MKHHDKIGLGEFTRGGKNEGTAREEQSKALLKGQGDRVVLHCVWGLDSMH